jgi:biopolymer transport protein ExbD
MSEINVVPYIDVMLVMLVIFMITAPLLNQGVDVELPEAASEPMGGDQQDPLVLTVDAEGREGPIGFDDCMKRRGFRRMGPIRRLFAG